MKPQGLRQLEDEPLQQERWKLSQAGSRKIFLEHGAVINGCDFKCWAPDCGGTLELIGGPKRPDLKFDDAEDVLRCSQCGPRPRLHQPTLAYTLFGGNAKPGAEPDWNCGLRAAWCLGNKMPNDTAIQACRKTGEPCSSHCLR